MYLTFHGLAKADADVFKSSEGRWLSTVRLHDKETGQVTLFTDGNATKVEALMAAFEMVDRMSKALQDLADTEGMKDFKGSIELVEEKKE